MWRDMDINDMACKVDGLKNSLFKLIDLCKISLQVSGPLVYLTLIKIWSGVD